jgi:MFS transporter, SP family, sugar:H+ symporter
MSSTPASTAPAEGQQAPITLKMILTCAYATFGGVLFGYDSGYINGILAMNEFKKDFGHPGWPSSNPEAYDGYLYDSWQKSIITSVLSAGTLVGALVSGYFADWCGRRTSIIIGCVIYIAGVVLQTAAQSVGLLSAGRAVAGVGVGFVSATVIMYVSEITPQKIRGRVVGAYQFAITLGLLLSACVAYGTKSRHDSGAYRIPIVLQFAWALILAIGLLCLPESPRWYVMKEKDERARKSLATLRDQPPDSVFVEYEHSELRRSWTHETTTGSGARGWLDCFKGGLTCGSHLHRTFVGTTIQMMQQLSKSSECKSMVTSH